MFVRESEAGLSTNFRLELEKHFRELRTVNDTKERELKRENIFHELSEVQCTKIQVKMSSLQKRMAANITIALGGLIGSVHIGGLSLLGVALHRRWLVEK